MLAKIKLEHSKSKEIYGAPRIERELRKQDIRTSIKRVNRLMISAGIRSKRHKKFVATTNSNHNLPVSANILNQNFTSVRPMEVVTSDITYIPTKQGWLYLSVVLDVFN